MFRARRLVLGVVVLVGLAASLAAAHPAAAVVDYGGGCTFDEHVYPGGGAVYGTVSDSCGASVTVCLEGYSESSGSWSAPFNCSSSTGFAETPTYTAGCGYGNFFRAVAQDSNLGNVWYATGGAQC